MEQEVKAAARRLIAQMSHAATHDDGQPHSLDHYQSLLAQLALAQLALTYPQASLGQCTTDGSWLRFVAKADGLYVCCTAEGEQHGWKIAGVG